MRYHIIVAYEDQTVKSERSNDIVAALQAVSIYLGDRDCYRAAIWDERFDIWVLDFRR